MANTWTWNCDVGKENGSSRERTEQQNCTFGIRFGDSMKVVATTAVLPAQRNPLRQRSAVSKLLKLSLILNYTRYFYTHFPKWGSVYIDHDPISWSFLRKSHGTVCCSLPPSSVHSHVSVEQQHSRPTDPTTKWGGEWRLKVKNKIGDGWPSRNRTASTSRGQCRVQWTIIEL